jgi:hypothetical protein
METWAVCPTNGLPADNVLLYDAWKCVVGNTVVPSIEASTVL